MEIANLPWSEEEPTSQSLFEIRSNRHGGFHGGGPEKDPRVADGRRARDVQGGVHRVRQEPGRHHHDQGEHLGLAFLGLLTMPI